MTLYDEKNAVEVQIKSNDATTGVVVVDIAGEEVDVEVSTEVEEGFTDGTDKVYLTASVDGRQVTATVVRHKEEGSGDIVSTVFFERGELVGQVFTLRQPVRKFDAAGAGSGASQVVRNPIDRPLPLPRRSGYQRVACSAIQRACRGCAVMAGLVETGGVGPRTICVP